jgi:hypothetical protein
VSVPDNDNSISEEKHMHIQEYTGIYRVWKKAKVLMRQTMHVYPGVVE